MESIQIFDKLAVEYDKWFEINDLAYQSEILAIQKFIPENGEGLEIGVGTGRFAVPLGIKTGVEPAPAMAQMARERGVAVYDARNVQFFRVARFYSAGEVRRWLEAMNFRNIESCQTIFANPGSTGQIRKGYGEGLFVVLAAVKG